MARLTKDLPGAEPVDKAGTRSGPPAILRAGTEYQLTIAKLRRPSDDIEAIWCEFQVGEQLYRVPRRTFDIAVAAA